MNVTRPLGVEVVESARGPGFAIGEGNMNGSGRGFSFLDPKYPPPTEPRSTRFTAPLSQPAVVTTALQVAGSRACS